MTISMAKKKKKQNVPLSPKAYLQSGRARKLPVTDALIPDNWMELGKFPIFIVRAHVNGRVTVANLLVDIWCCGVKDAHFMFNMSRDEFDSIIYQYSDSTEIQFVNIDYSLAHNIIYESLAYAEEYGIDPHPDFDLVELLLEEDDERIPRIEVPLGYNGQPVLMLNEEDPRNQYYLKQLEENAGPGNFQVAYDNPSGDWEDESDKFDLPFYEDWEKEDWIAFFKDNPNEYLNLYAPLVGYLFNKCIYTPGLAGNQLGAGLDTEIVNFGVSFEPLEEDEYSATELKAVRKIHERIDRAKNRRDWGRLLTDTTNALNQWPDNRPLHNYLSVIYEATEQHEKRRDLLIEVNEKFPDYIFGKISLGNFLLEQDKFEDFEELFDRKYDLKSIYPDREEFHFSEFTAFSQLMGMYFMAKDDLVMANLYSNLIFQVMGDDLDENRINPYFLNGLLEKNFEAVTDLVNTIKGNPKKIEEVAILLTD